MERGTYVMDGEVGVGTRTLTLTPEVVEIPPGEHKPKYVGVSSVPYFSQWDKNVWIEQDGSRIHVDADAVRGDCGPAVLNSLVWHFAGERATVDEVGLACGQPRVGKGVRYTTNTQLILGAAEYGLRLKTRSKWRPPIYDWEMAYKALTEGRPSIALINAGALMNGMKEYPALPQTQDIGYRDGHWVAVVRCYSLDGTVIVEVMDPDFWGARRGDGSYRKIPLDVFKQAIAVRSKGCSVGNQGLELIL